MRQLRQPRLAEIVASSLRDDILTGKLKEGDSLPRQEDLFTQFRVSLPAIREAMRILETEGLVTVRRGNVGGAVVHLPTAERTAQMISMVLQTKGATPGDVSGALESIEPVCARLCATREDRAETVVPALHVVVDAQRTDFDDVALFNADARRFHETLVQGCGSETLILVVGALETIWSAHEEAVLDADPGPDTPLDRKVRRAALRDHAKLLAAIEAGGADRAFTLASAHLAATRRSVLARNEYETINASLVGRARLSAARRPGR